MSFYIDLSEFLTNPIRTGIQRIEGEMCRYLPPNTAIPVRLHSGSYVALPQELIGTIGKYFREADESSALEIRKMSAVENGSRIRVSERDTVLVPEVFDDPDRVAFFREMTEQELHRIRFIVYDLLPATHPEYFGADRFTYLFGYFRLLRRATSCGFISEYTRDVYFDRLKRTSARNGVILPLGSDSLGARAERPVLNRPLTFTVLGTIEPRKNHELILDAFEPFLRQVDGLKLAFAGKMGWVDSEFAQRVHALASDKNSGFHFHSKPGDDDIRNYIKQSRATIYISAAEGYGLPPVESLWLGTPVIASAMIPSLSHLGSAGVHYVQPLNVMNLRRAVLDFMDNDYANRKTEEAIQVNLATWKSFTQEVLRWCAQG